VKKKYQIISILALAILTACGGASEEKQTSEHSDNATKTTEHQATNQKDITTEELIQTNELSDTLSIAETELSAVDPIIAGSEVDGGITAEEAAAISATLHSGSNEIPKEQQDMSPDEVVVEEVAETGVTEEIVVVEEVVKTKIDHKTWDALVRKNVSSSGKVNYKAFKAQKAQVQTYLDQLSAEKPASDWTKNEKLAYWINAYNAFTVKLIIDNYPVQSITKLHGGKPWDEKFITLGGTKYSLGQIENDILRKMHEPRIHFAINCASGSCPNILNKAFVADKMSSQLKKVTNSFLNDTSKNDFSGKKLKISELFNWYAKDFKGGDIIAFLNQYRTEQLDANTKIEFLPYDWSLNE